MDTILFHRRPIVVVLLLAAAAGPAAGEEIPRLRKVNGAVQLLVGGRPWIMLAGELHNSSSSGLEYMKAVWPDLRALHLNTVIASVSWELVEPQEGKFDFASVDGLLAGAREHGLRLVLIWFASWKNGVSSYAPAWVLRDTKRFARCQGSSNRNTKDILTPLSAANRDADGRAFAAVMKHLREVDSQRRTVIMMQVENEVGIKPEPRDLSEAGDRAFAAAVPGELTAYLSAHRDELVAELRDGWQKAGGRTAGTWREVFGASDAAAEAFMAWHYARYMHAVVRAGKAQYDLPMFVNAWLRAPGGKVGQYPSGGPVAHVLDIWRAAGGDIDLYAPDIYLGDFKGVCAEYTFAGNPLLIPEAHTDSDAVGRAFWAFGRHGALGFSPFGIDHVRPDHPLADGYAVLGQLAGPLSEAYPAGRVAAVWQQNNEPAPDKPLRVGHYLATVTYSKRRGAGPAPYGLIIQTGDDELIVAGWGIEVGFHDRRPGPRNTRILQVEMGRFDGGKWLTEMRLNGDETGANYRAKIPPNPTNTRLDPGRPRILRVRVYRHE